MEKSTELVTIETDGRLDGKLASGGFYLPKIANSALPGAATHEGMVVYDTTNDAVVFSNGTAWETVTSAVP